MIVDAIIEFISACINGIAAAIVGFIPPPPQALQDGISLLGDLYGVVSTLETWVPVDLALTMAGIIVGTYFIAVTIGVCKTVVSYLTFGGGAT